MIIPAIGTIATRVVQAVVNLAIVAVTAHWLGLEDVGRIALLVLGVTMIQLLSNMVGASGLVYLLPRYGASALRLPSYAWACVVCVIAWLGLHLIPIVPAGLEIHTAALALLQSLAAVNLAVLLGRQRFGWLNGLQAIGSVLQLLSYLLLLKMDGATVMDYVIATYIANAFVLVASTIAVRGTDLRSHSARQAFLDLFRLGFFAQLANALQLMNYRLAYYLVDRFQGSGALGMFSITTQLAESTWLAPKSLGTVLYARVSNTEGLDQQRDLTLAVLKVAIAFAALVGAVLLLLPIDLYRWVFGEDVHDLGPVLLWMLPGLIAMSASQAYSHYLSGTGRVVHNTIASGIGLVITIAVGYRWIPVMGLYGAALASSAAYTAATLYQLVVFNRITGAHLRHYLPTAQDRERITLLYRRFLGR